MFIQKFIVIISDWMIRKPGQAEKLREKVESNQQLHIVSRVFLQDQVPINFYLKSSKHILII